MPREVDFFFFLSKSHSWDEDITQLVEYLSDLLEILGSTSSNT